MLIVDPRARHVAVYNHHHIRMFNAASSSSQVIDPTDTYQLDSDEFEDNDSDNGSLDDREYEALLDEGDEVRQCGTDL
jgi:hypothetical protein